MTIDYLSIDLTGVFEYGMTYVALSRGVSCDHMSVKGFQLKEVRTNPKVIAFYDAVKQGTKYIAKSNPSQIPLVESRSVSVSSQSRPTPLTSVTSPSVAARPIQSRPVSVSSCQSRPTPLTSVPTYSIAARPVQSRSISLPSSQCHPIQSHNNPLPPVQCNPTPDRPVSLPSAQHSILSSQFKHSPTLIPHHVQYQQQSPTSVSYSSTIQQPHTDLSFETFTLFKSKSKSPNKKRNSLVNLASGLQSLNKSFISILCLYSQTEEWNTKSVKRLLLKELTSIFSELYSLDDLFEKRSKEWKMINIGLSTDIVVKGSRGY